MPSAAATTIEEEFTDHPPEQVVFAPQPGPQETFFSTPADIAVIGGAVFGGKTWALCAEPLRHRDVDGFSAVMFRRVQPEIRQPGGMWEETMKMYDMFGGHPREDVLEWRFGTPPRPGKPRGGQSIVKMSGLQYEKDANSWKGAQITLLCFDQLEEFTERQFWYLQSRNRSTCGVKPYTRASCNPMADTWLARFIQWWWDKNTGYSIPERSGVIRWFVKINDVVHWSNTACKAGVTGARFEAVKKIALAEMSEKFPSSGLDKHGKPKRAPGSFARSFTYVLATIDDNVIGTEADPDYEARVRSMSYIEQERLLGIEGRGGNWLIKPAAGLIFNRTMVEDGRILPVAPADLNGIVRAWDKAGTVISAANPDPDATAGILIGRWGKEGQRKYVILDLVHDYLNADKRNARMKYTAQRDAELEPQVRIFFEQEPASGGKESAQITVEMLAEYPVRAVRADTNIYERADPLAAQWQAGNVYIVKAHWNELLLQQFHSFTGSGKEHDDCISAAALGFNMLQRVPDESEYDQYEAVYAQ